MHYEYFISSGKLHIVELDSMIKKCAINGDVYLVVKELKDITINRNFRSSTWKNLFPTAINVPAKHVFLEDRDDEKAKGLLKEYYLQKLSDTNKSVDKINDILVYLS